MNRIMHDDDDDDDDDGDDGNGNDCNGDHTSTQRDVYALFL